jgi:hypothetical protein
MPHCSAQYGQWVATVVAGFGMRTAGAKSAPQHRSAAIVGFLRILTKRPRVAAIDPTHLSPQEASATNLCDFCHAICSTDTTRRSSPHDCYKFE